MKKPTKEERHQIYIDAIEEMPICNGLCSALKWAKSNRGKYNPYLFMKEYFPEIYKMKPKNIDHNSGEYWFALGNKKSRIKILEKAIKETKP